MDFKTLYIIGVLSSWLDSLLSLWFEFFLKTNIDWLNCYWGKFSSCPKAGILVPEDTDMGNSCKWLHLYICKSEQCKGLFLIFIEHSIFQHFMSSDVICLVVLSHVLEDLSDFKHVNCIERPRLWVFKLIDWRFVSSIFGFPFFFLLVFTSIMLMSHEDASDSFSFFQLSIMSAVWPLSLSVPLWVVNVIKKWNI